MKTDEYGQVHNSPETYKHLANQLDYAGGSIPQVFSWVDERMSRFTLMLYLGVNPQQVREGLLYVGVEGHGFNGFPVLHHLDAGYVASRLKLALGSAEPLADLLNGVLDNIYPHRSVPSGTIVEEWADAGIMPDTREYRKPDIDIFVEADKDLTCICKTDSSMDWAAGDPNCPVHAVWQEKKQQ
jgi:hypothetical protein